jgi:hypothetical protein
LLHRLLLRKGCLTQGNTPGAGSTLEDAPRVARKPAADPDRAAASPVEIRPVPSLAATRDRRFRLPER